ncbi:hypothetical protein BD413DRAFT_84735 [Trametes elegans]|nr:hypothetical protein BD413DRAFT_84735 [Trametes elegans]
MLACCCCRCPRLCSRFPLGFRWVRASPDSWLPFPLSLTHTHTPSVTVIQHHPTAISGHRHCGQRRRFRSPRPTDVAAHVRHHHRPLSAFRASCRIISDTRSTLLFVSRSPALLCVDHSRAPARPPPVLDYIARPACAAVGHYRRAVSSLASYPVPDTVCYCYAIGIGIRHLSLFLSPLPLFLPRTLVWAGSVQ